MISESSQKQFNEANEFQDEEKVEEKLTPQMMMSPSFQQQIRDVVFTLIPEVPRLRDLFMSWECLTPEDKVIVDEYTKTNSTGMELYKPLLDALRQWDKIQNTQGAPGFDCGTVTLTGHPQIETALSNVVYTLECLMAKLQEDTTSEQVDNYNASRLTSSLGSVCDEDKNRGDNTDAPYNLFPQRKAISLDDIPKQLGKKLSVFSL